MTPRSSRGASTGVQRALGWANEQSVAHRSEVASCTQCGAELRFTTGEYGQTLEVCTGPSCPGRRPHAPRPDPSPIARALGTRGPNPRRKLS